MALNNRVMSSLLSNLCCSKCKNDFTEESITIVEQHEDLLVCKLICQICGKDFGNVILNIDKKNKKTEPLKVVEGLEPITYDDVIEAHKYIRQKL